jgi:hypothetical protein
MTKDFEIEEVYQTGGRYADTITKYKINNGFNGSYLRGIK